MKNLSFSLSLTLACMALPYARVLLMWCLAFPFSQGVGEPMVENEAFLYQNIGDLVILSWFRVLSWYIFVYIPRCLYANRLNAKAVFMQRFPKSWFLLCIIHIILSAYMQTVYMQNPLLYKQICEQKWFGSAYMQI